MIHALKIEPNYYEDIKSGNKSFEVRKNDRDFRTGDYIALNELFKAGDEYTGRSILVKITSIVNDERFCKKGYVIMGLVVCIIIENGGRHIEIDGEARKI